RPRVYPPRLSVVAPVFPNQKAPGMETALRQLGRSRLVHQARFPLRNGASDDGKSTSQRKHQASRPSSALRNSGFLPGILRERFGKNNSGESIDEEHLPRPCPAKHRRLGESAGASA